MYMGKAIQTRALGLLSYLAFLLFEVLCAASCMVVA